MQVAYSPWGKPGGGAKYEGSLRKKNVHLEPLTVPKTSHGTTQVKKQNIYIYNDLN